MDSRFRTLASACWEEEGAELRFRVVGEGFLRGMVRALVGTLVEVGTGRRSPESFAGLLAGWAASGGGTHGARARARSGAGFLSAGVAPRGRSGTACANLVALSHGRPV